MPGLWPAHTRALHTRSPHTRTPNRGRKAARFFLLFLLLQSARAADTVDPSTLQGKVLLGYQGWFNCPGDGSPGNNWRSWDRGVPGSHRKDAPDQGYWLTLDADGADLPSD